MIAVVDVAKATPRQDEFTVDLPDFAHLGEGFFEFSLIQPETRRSSRLTPLQNGRPSFDLKAQSSYEAPVEFAVEAPRAFATQ